ncbi:MAG: LPP20 family lipoprotein [Nitrospirales bacterium]|nr:LPP20 family lipoprotein [Nitrospirales bacterium]
MKGMVLALALLLTACASTPKVPDWAEGTKAAAYPDEQFLIGVGQADSKPVAEERAYAAVSRIFKAEVTSQAKDWETYLTLEKRGNVQTERRLTLDSVTKVSTDKVLENVKIAETWRDQKTGIHSALAVMNRTSAHTSFRSKIAELDEAVGRDVKEARGAQDKYLKVRGLRRAIRTLITRDIYNSDLRVVTGGRGVAADYSVAGLTVELEKLLNESIVVAVEVKGDQAEAVRQAVMEGLAREGLPVTARSAPGDTATADLLVKGEARLWPADLPDPRFRYVRWCADFVIVNQQNQLVLGSVARSGREGHLNIPEATGRALKSLQQDVSSALAKSLAEHIFGDPPSDAVPPQAACPKP